MAISKAYVVVEGTVAGHRSLTFTQKRKAIRAARLVARRRPGARISVRTSAGELIYQCHAEREGHEAIRIVSEEL